MSNQPKSDRNISSIESLFTKSIKQQRNRHECWCGKVGCIAHPKQNALTRSRTAERLKQAAAKAASRERPTQKRANLQQWFVAIQRSIRLIVHPQWQRYGHEYKTKTIAALSVDLDELVRRDSRLERNALVTKARQIIQKFWSNNDAAR